MNTKDNTIDLSCLYNDRQVQISPQVKRLPVVSDRHLIVNLECRGLVSGNKTIVFPRGYDHINIQNQLNELQSWFKNSKYTIVDWRITTNISEGIWEQVPIPSFSYPFACYLWILDPTNPHSDFNNQIVHFNYLLSLEENMKAQQKWRGWDAIELLEVQSRKIAFDKF